MKAMILAAGFGTRFRPVTYDTPKPMIPLCNRPLIDFAVDSLLQFGVRDIVVNLHHLPELIERHLVETYHRECSLHFSFEPEILGTGGGVRKARPLLEGSPAFFLVNADTIQFPPFGRLERALAETGSLAALLLRHRPSGDSYTKVYFDGTYVTGFGEGEGEALMFAGSHAVSREIFNHLPDRDVSGITEDVYIPMLLERRARLSGTVHDGLWFDIGTPRRYMIATDEVRERILAGEMSPDEGSMVRGNSIVHRTAGVEGEVEASIIGSDSVIENGARVVRSVIWRDGRVASHSVVEGSILADGVELPIGSVARNAMVSIHQDRNGAAWKTVGRFSVASIDSERELVFHVS